MSNTMDGAERYYISDERLAEIRGMLLGDGISWPRVAPGVSREMLAGAIWDFLAERDDDPASPSPEQEQQ